MNEKSVSGEEHTTLTGRSAQKKSKLLKNPVANTSGRKRKKISVRSIFYSLQLTELIEREQHCGHIQSLVLQVFFRVLSVCN